MDEDILAPDPAIQAAKDNYSETDVFAWANNLVEHSSELKFELFFISKAYTLYKMSTNNSIKKQLEPIFINNLLESILMGVDAGLTVRNFEDSEQEDGVLQRTQLYKVDNAREALNWAKAHKNEIETFKDSEHDFKRMKGILAKVSTPNDADDPFYVAKMLPAGNVMSSRTGWMVREGKFIEFDAEAVLKIPNDNQLLILDQDIYVFNQGKLKQLFGYDAKEAAIAAEKAEEILAKFDLMFAPEVDMQSLLAGKKSLIKKLQNLNIGETKHKDLVDLAEELDVNIMTDDSGAFIIEDAKDLGKFISLLNDDFIESSLTGERYEIIRKKPIEVPKDEF